MTWTAKGADRGKSFQVYRDLENRYTTAQAQLLELQSELQRKNETIRSLARELAAMAGGSEPDETMATDQESGVQAATQADSAPPSGQQPTVQPAGTLLDRLGQYEAERRAEKRKKGSK